MSQKTRITAAFLAAGTGVVGAVGTARGQMAPIRGQVTPWAADSGLVRAPSGAGGATVVYRTTVFVPRASWLRLRFKAVGLSGLASAGTGSYLRLASLQDGAVQYLNAESAKQWADTSAYFNGDAVRVELIAWPGTGDSRVEIVSATAGTGDGGSPIDSICGPTDDRVLLNDPRSARHLPEGCTSWLFNDTNHMFLTAGHCSVSVGDVQEFNVPLSNAGGGINHPPPEDQYAVDPTSVQFTYIGIGADYTYFACYPNSNTGQTAFQRQGQHFTLATAAPAVAGQTIRVSGYGVTGTQGTPLTWSQVATTAMGPYFYFLGTTIGYQVDTTGGNSGSAVQNLANNTVIGIHTNAGCSNPVGTTFNTGTAIQYAGIQGALANPLTLCRSGRAAAIGALYAIGDGVNNFGTLNTATGAFGKVADEPPRMSGLAYNWNTGLFFALSNDTYGLAPGPAGMKLWTIDPASGAAVYLTNVSGAAGLINDLGYDPTNNVLYGVANTTGTRVTINPATGAVTVDGAANGGAISALEFDPNSGTLFGIDNGGGASKLVMFTPDTGAEVVIGNLGAGIASCNGLAVMDDGSLWTINAATRQLLRVDRASGLATVVGATGGVFGAAYGMSAVLTRPVAGCYANCDGSTTPPVLNVNDFSCFLNKFSAGDLYANCDGSTTPPVLNVNDFSCFLNRFSAGCS